MRRAQIDDNSQLHRNLVRNPAFEADGTAQAIRTNIFTNPSFETGSGTVNVRTNLAINPSFEAASGVINVRTNLCTNPNFEAGSGTATVRTNLATNPSPLSATGWSPQSSPNGVFTTTLETTGSPVGANFRRMLCTTAPATWARHLTAANTPVTPGDTYTASAYIRHNRGTNGAYVGIVWYDSVGGYISELATSFTVSADAWTQGKTTSTAPANAATLSVFISIGSGVVAGDTIDAAGLLLEKIPTMLPYFDGTTPAASRTNLCPNPSSANGNGWFPASSTLPVTFTVNNAGGPVGTPFSRMLATGTATGTNYFAIAQGSTTPAQWSSATPGLTYTISAYVRATMVNYQQPKIRMRWKNSAGVTITDEPLVSATGTASGQWVRLSATGIAPAGTVYIEAMAGFVSIDYSTIVAGDTLDVSALLVEQSSVLGAYFDGATSAAGGFSYGWRGTANASISYATSQDFTHVWTGTANASTSNQNATGLTNWLSSTTSSVYQSGMDPKVGSKVAGVLTKGANGDGIYFADIAVTAGKAYTSSIWIKTTSAITLSGVLRFKDNAQTILGDLGGDISASLVIGSWVRVSVTGVAPANSTKLQMMWRTFAAHTPTTFYVDGSLVIESGVDTAYFDGATTAAGDFTYAWSGAVNASTSYQQAPIISSWINRWFGASGGAGTLYQAKGGVSGNYARKLWTQANTAATMDAGINPTANTPVSASTPYTLSAWVRCSVSQYFNFYVDWKDSGGTSISISRDTNATLVSANTWTRLSTSATSPSAATSATFIVGPYNQGQPMPAGSTMDFDNVLVEASPSMQVYFDGTNTISNVCVNPSFDTDTTGWSFNNLVAGYGRKTTRGFVGTSSVWGVATDTSGDSMVVTTTNLIVQPSTTYTVSAYAWVPAGVVATDFRSANRNLWAVSWNGATPTTSAGNLDFSKTDQWQRVSTTFTTPTVVDGLSVRLYCPVNALGVYWDAVMVERSSTVNPYYEGTGDFTYAWSGTANASTSLQQAPGVAGIGLNISGAAGSLSKIYQTKSGLSGKALKITKQGGYVYVDYTMAGLAASTTYTFSYDVLTSQNKIGTVDRGTSAAPLYGPADKTVTPDVWTRINRQVTTGVGETTRVISMAGWEMATVPDGSSVIIDNVVIESGTAAQPYFDGSTANTPDFTYSWTGAANASTSRLTVMQPLNAATPGGRLGYTSTAWSASGTKSFAVPPWSSISTDAFGSPTGETAHPGIIPGNTYTFMVKCYVPAVQTGSVTGAARGIQVKGLISGNQTVLGTATAPNVVGVYDLRVKVTIPNDGTILGVFTRLFNGSFYGNTPIYFDNFMIVEGDYTGDFIDGSKPFSKWEGTTNASTSIGYPPRFLDVIGKPMAEIYTEGATLVPISGGAFDDCTVYLVYEAYTEIAEWTTLASVGGWSAGSPDWAVKGAFSYGRRNGGDLRTSHSRVGNSLNSNISGMGTPVPGAIIGFKPSRHVVAIQLTDGATAMRSVLDGGTEFSVGFPSGNGIAREFMKLRTGTSSTEGTASVGAKGLAMLYYPGRHDATTRQAVSRYLGNKYGANVA